MPTNDPSGTKVTLDSILDKFEKAWQSGKPPRLEVSVKPIELKMR